MYGVLTITTPAPRGISTRNRQLLALLNQEFDGPFSVREAALALGYTIEGSHRFLAYLAARGWLVRVSRGYYATVPLDAIVPTEWREDPWLIASKVYGPSCYIGGWTACEYWNLTDQLFNATVLFTTRKVRNTETDVQGSPLRIRHTRHDNLFGTQPVWRGRSKVDISDPSRTLVDILDAPELGAGIRHVAEVLDSYFDSEHLDESLLLEYAGRLGNRTVFKRLGCLLETLGIEAPELVQACREQMSSGISLLDPSMPGRGPTRRRWNLRLNATILSERSAF